VRERKVTIVVQDPSLHADTIITGDEPPEAFGRLKELLDDYDKIRELPGRAAEVRYRDGEGWVRPF
jgi:hypothetical protein